MKITINNKLELDIKTYLSTSKSKLPAFELTKDITYNGVVVEVDDEDIEDFVDAMESAGFDFELDEEDGGFTTPRWPKKAPRLPKGAPRWPKSVPKLEKVTPKWPRAYKPYKPYQPHKPK